LEPPVDDGDGVRVNAVHVAVRGVLRQLQGERHHAAVHNFFFFALVRGAPRQERLEELLEPQRVPTRRAWQMMLATS